MKLPMFQVDAFTDRLFSGNPAAVCPLEAWLPDATLQAIAAENNLAETAYFVRRADGDYDLRWFTPTTEVNLCGHATVASAFVLFHHLGHPSRAVTFHSQSGVLGVTEADGLYSMRFPRWDPSPCAPPPGLVEALGRRPVEVLKRRDYVAVYETEADVRALKPDFAALSRIDAMGTVVTAPGESCDFISRYFAPAAGVPEDPATGSSHCELIPYWSSRLGKKSMRALQVSARGGEFHVEDLGDAVRIAGRAVLYLEGTART
jgi:predicted PhzF superfamily epimerase YddE/YHI9